MICMCMCYQARQAEVGQMTSQVLTAGSSQSPGQPVIERAARFLPGLRMLVLGIALLLGGVALAVLAAHLKNGAAIAVVLPCALVFLAPGLALPGLTAVVPGQPRRVQLYARNRGRSPEPRLSWGNP